ncbi:MAG: CCA tRNA nucleotidyltransferase, partial [Lachnospiraceae bacterium]|nr:CCA tRNA nucleotidyltransferase [Lachnospiraceae bacterium]
MVLPENVHFIIDVLRSAGNDAYAVGGCVRDSLLGRTPEDWDITTSASPDEVKVLFKRTVDTGIEHGTVTVMIDKTGYEVTTYRVDGKYKDGRHPESVTFTRSLEEDLKRRDFTINAMAFNENDGIVDLFDGRKDLEARLVRCVGDPRQRFGEDALRILRAVRFSAQLGFEIEEETAKAMGELAGTLEKISAERIRTELDKLLASDHPEKLMKAYELGITKVILPEFDEMMKVTPTGKHHIYPVGEHAIEAVKKISPQPDLLRWTMLLHDVGKPGTQTTGEDGESAYHGHGEAGAEIADRILKRLKFDNH